MCTRNNARDIDSWQDEKWRREHEEKWTNKPNENQDEYREWF